MSLGKLMLRNLTVLALTGRTLAADEVVSSALAPLTEMKPGDNDRPVIAVFTDTTSAGRENVQGKDIIAADEAVTLALEFAVFTAPPKQDGQGIEIGIPETDEGMEMTLDIMQWQSVVELQTGDTKWANLWRSLVMRVVGLSTERGGSIDRGVRFAARRFEIQVELVADPIPTLGVSAVWAEAIEALEADPRTASTASVLRSVLAGAPLADYGASLGINRDAASAIGIAAVDPTPRSVAAPIAEIVAEPDDGEAPIVVEIEGE